LYMPWSGIKLLLLIIFLKVPNQNKFKFDDNHS
jgi:hypothetical protein